MCLSCASTGRTHATSWGLIQGLMGMTKPPLTASAWFVGGVMLHDPASRVDAGVGLRYGTVHFGWPCALVHGLEQCCCCHQMTVASRSTKGSCKQQNDGQCDPEMQADYDFWRPVL